MGSQRLQQKCISVTLQTAAETDALSRSQSLMRFGTKTGPRPRTEISFPERELCDINVCHAFQNPPLYTFSFQFSIYQRWSGSSCPWPGNRSCRGEGGRWPQSASPQSSLTWTGGCGNVERARGSRAEQQRDPETEKREKEEGEGTWH